MLQTEQYGPRELSYRDVLDRKLRCICVSSEELFVAAPALSIISPTRRSSFDRSFHRAFDGLTGSKILYVFLATDCLLPRRLESVDIAK